MEQKPVIMLAAAMQIYLPEEISQNFQKTKDFFNESAGNAVSSVSQANQQAKTALSQSAGQAIQSLNQITENAKTTLTQTTTNAVNTVSEKTNQAINSVSAATNAAKASLQETIQQAETLNRTLSEGIQASINSSLSSWIAGHPRLIWLVNHPLQSLVLLLLGLFLLSGLLKAVSNVTEKFWVWLFSFPFKLVGFGWGLIPKSSQGREKKLEDILRGNDRQARMTTILSRLEAIKKEQDLLLEELATVLKSEKWK
ncbi:hypothetical protein NG798_08535 [Ancylothrix sp. C2]|uniref:hypothetical protein n=1 Tax=Ancylothrix sp. D3o TaxID=2953691 RepID=UPI0021BB40C9|nr:hypothetical protein [Ancylothrix sp. D3o]MCT7949831.1 hypothetical protein [Ancylothrix sp. D3o]